MKIGDRFQSQFLVTPEIYEGFISLFNDRNPLHVDTAFARKAGFKDRVMHGNILGGFLSHFVGELLPLKEVALVSQNIRFRNPVYLNDRLELRMLVSAVSEATNILEFQFEFLKEDGVKSATGALQIRRLV